MKDVVHFIFIYLFPPYINWFYYIIVVVVVVVWIDLKKEIKNHWIKLPVIHFVLLLAYLLSQWMLLEHHYMIVGMIVAVTGAKQHNRFGCFGILLYSYQVSGILFLLHHFSPKTLQFFFFLLDRLQMPRKQKFSSQTKKYLSTDFNQTKPKNKQTTKRNEEKEEENNLHWCVWAFEYFFEKEFVRNKKCASLIRIFWKKEYSYIFVFG